MGDLGWRRRRGSGPAARKGRAAARGLDARLRLQHHFMPAGDASLKTLRSIKNPIDSDHGIYRDRLLEILEALDAARELERRAEIGAEDVVRLGELVVPKGIRARAAGGRRDIGRMKVSV